MRSDSEVALGSIVARKPLNDTCNGNVLIAGGFQCNVAAFTDKLGLPLWSALFITSNRIHMMYVSFNRFILLCHPAFVRIPLVQTNKGKQKRIIESRYIGLTFMNDSILRHDFSI